MIQESIKNAYIDICDNYIKPYLEGKGLNLEESYLGMNINTDLYISGWSSSDKSTVIPLKYDENNGFVVVNEDMNPIHIHEWIEETDDILINQGLYEIDSDTKVPNYKVMATGISWDDYSIYHGIIKELKINGRWINNALSEA